MNSTTNISSHRICFASDLHLFCDRSSAEQYFAAIDSAASTCDQFVLGGDIFDFKWSRIGSLSESIAEACLWLNDLIGANPGCQFHFLPGNHDCRPEFLSEVNELSKRTDNLQTHDYVLRLGDTVFLHGDVVDCSTATQAGLESQRQKWANESPKGELMNTAYNMLIAIKLHRHVARSRHSLAPVANKLLTYLEDIAHGPENGVSRVVFGHTHWATQFVSNGVQFLNGGAAIQGLPFEILNLNIANDNSIESRKSD